MARTYLVVRLWPYPRSTFNPAGFEDIQEAELPMSLGVIAARWIAQSGQATDGTETASVVGRIVQLAKDLAFSVDENTSRELGMDYLKNAVNGKWQPKVPAWKPFHAESSLERAEFVRDALLRHVKLPGSPEYRCFQAEFLRPLDAVGMERSIEQFDEVHEPVRYLNSSPGRSGWQQLRAEALEYSAYIDRIPVRLSGQGTSPTDESVQQPVATPEVEQDGILSAHDLAEMYEVPYDALRKRLERWKRSHDDGYHEVKNKKRGAPVFLFEVKQVLPLLRDLKASMSASIERPSSKKHPPEDQRS